MENLSKENFWDELNEKYPKGFREFSDWIDEYKVKNLWGSICMDGVKYHNLPLAMQIGIWIEFVCDRGGCTWEIEDMFSQDWEEEITGYMKMIHEDLLISQQY